MRQIRRLTIILSTIVLIAGCKKDDSESENKPNYGPQYFECKVNGEPFKARSTFLQCEGHRFDYYPDTSVESPKGFMILRGTNCTNYETVGIGIHGVEPNTGWMDFLEPSIADSISPYYSFWPEDSTQSNQLYKRLVTGEMAIDELVPRANGYGPYGTIQGSFEFTVTDDRGEDTVRVTEGRFRLDVPHIF